MSLDAEATAFKTRLATATRYPVYDYDEAAKVKDLPSRYTVISVEYRFGGNARSNGSRETDLRRLTVTVAARTISDARVLLDRVMAEFRYSEVSFESGDGAPKPDDGYYSASVDFTYSA